MLFFSEKGQFISQVDFPSAFLPSVEYFCLEDYKTILVERLDSNFSLNRFQIKLVLDEEKDKTEITDCKFHFEHVGVVKNSEMSA